MRDSLHLSLLDSLLNSINNFSHVLFSLFIRLIKEIPVSAPDTTVCVCNFLLYCKSQIEISKSQNSHEMLEILIG